jgi:hypothetical protein
MTRFTRTQSSVRVFVAFLGLWCVFASQGCRGVPDPPPSARRDQTAWRPLGTWSGHGHKQTESFTSDTGTLRAHWQTTNPDATGGVFRLTIHSAISGRPLEQIVEHTGAGKGTAYLYEEPRVFHAVVDSAGLDWTVTIEEGVVGSLAGPR